MLTPLSTGIIFVSSRVFEDYLAENLGKHQIFSGGKKIRKKKGVWGEGCRSWNFEIVSLLFSFELGKRESREGKIKYAIGDV